MFSIPMSCQKKRRFPFSQDMTQTPVDMSRSLLHVLVPGNSRYKAPKKIKSTSREPRKGIRNLYSPVQSLLGVFPFVCMHHHPQTIFIYSHHRLLHRSINSAALRWCSKRFSSSAEVAVASWPSKEEVVAALSCPTPSLHSYSETS